MQCTYNDYNDNQQKGREREVAYNTIPWMFPTSNHHQRSADVMLCGMVCKKYMTH